jgi:hypothetical protein
MLWITPMNEAHKEVIAAPRTIHSVSISHKSRSLPSSQHGNRQKIGQIIARKRDDRSNRPAGGTRAACKIGLKALSRSVLIAPTAAGRCKHWLKTLRIRRTAGSGTNCFSHRIHTRPVRTFLAGPRSVAADAHGRFENWPM